MRDIILSFAREALKKGARVLIRSQMKGLN